MLDRSTMEAIQVRTFHTIKPRICLGFVTQVNVWDVASHDPADTPYGKLIKQAHLVMEMGHQYYLLIVLPTDLSRIDIKYFNFAVLSSYGNVKQFLPFLPQLMHIGEIIVIFHQYFEYILI